MDEQVTLAWLVGAMAAAAAFFFTIFYKHRSQFTGANLPPGKIGYPAVGETLRWLYSGWKGHPETFIFDRMTEFNTEIFRTSLLGEPTAVFCGAACNKFLFSNENKLVTTWWPSSIYKIFPSTPETMSVREEGIKMRKLLPNFMKPDALQRYIAVMDVIAKRCFAADWEERSEVETFKLTKRYTFWLAAKLFVSIDDPKEIAKFEDPFRVMAAGIISLHVDFPGSAFRKAIDAANFIRAELIKIIKQRRIDLANGSSSYTQDILSHMLLVSTEEGFEMSELSIADKILALLIGGHDTTSAACTFVVKYLAELPHVYDAVYKEQMEIAGTKAEGELLTWEDLHKMKYSWNVAQEVMRVAPPLQGAFREALTDFSFKGFSIPKGWKMYWSTNSTHKSAEYFPEPHKFDPARFEGSGPAPYTFVPFGGGPRMCPGKEYARLEILVFMHNLVRRFRFEKIIPDEGIVVNPIPMPANGLPIRLFPHAYTARNPLTFSKAN